MSDMFSSENIGLLVTALSGLLIAAGQFVTARQKKRVWDAETMAHDLDVRNAQVVVALRQIGMLERMLATNGIDVPKRPKELSSSWDGDQPVHRTRWHRKFLEEAKQGE